MDVEVRSIVRQVSGAPALQRVTCRPLHSPLPTPPHRRVECVIRQLSHNPIVVLLLFCWIIWGFISIPDDCKTDKEARRHRRVPRVARGARWLSFILPTFFTKLRPEPEPELEPNTQRDTLRSRRKARRHPRAR